MKFNNENYDAAIKYLKEKRIEICKKCYNGEQDRCSGECMYCSFYCDFSSMTNKSFLIKNIKETVKSFMETTNTFVAKCDDTTVSLCKNSGDKYSLDVNRLRVEEPEMYAKYRKESQGSSWLRII